MSSLSAATCDSMSYYDPWLTQKALFFVFFMQQSNVSFLAVNVAKKEEAIHQNVFSSSSQQKHVVSCIHTFLSSLPIV